MTLRVSLSVIAVAAAIGLGNAALAQSGFTPADKQKSQSPPIGQFTPPAAAKSAPPPSAPPAPTARKDAPRTQTAAATPSAGPPNALQGFSQNKDEPVKISSATLEVRDKERIATFNGNVQLAQGDTTLTCATLVVHYEDEQNKSTMTTAVATPGGGQQRIRRLEARGNVHVVQKEQTVTGENGIFDMRANTVTLTGNVVIARGKNIMRGAQRLTVDLTNGVSRMEGGRVEGLFINDAPPPAKDPKADPNTDMLKLPRSPRIN